MIASDVIKELINLYHENKLAHAYLIETNSINDAIKDINYFIKNIVCNGKYKDNCHECNLCHLINNDSLPSLLFVYPDGKTIKKDQVELIKSKFSNKPIYTNYNIYVIVEPELMNETAFNKMLKFIEEPEDNIIGFFITSNKDKIADTIVSRLETVKFYYGNNCCYKDNTINDETKLKIDSFLSEYKKKIINIDELLCYNVNVIQKELTDKAEIVYFFQSLLDYYQTSLINDYSIRNVELCNLIIKYLERLNYNVNISLLLDSFAIEMEYIYEK